MKTCIVEVADQPVGILQQTSRGYVFSSTDPTTAKLDGQRYASVARAIKRARSCIASNAVGYDHTTTEESA